MRRHFATLDVFTDRHFAGNPLAVVLDGEGIETAVMQAIAREFGHPETVFVLPPGDRRHRAAVRIFTPARELAFAGHPTVGTAVLLAVRDGAALGDEFVLEEKIGEVRCRLESKANAGGAARFTIPQLPNEEGSAASNADIAAALGLAPADIGFDDLLPSRWSCGNAFTFVPVSGLAAIGRCRVDLGKYENAFADGAVYVFCAETLEPGSAFHARMFAPKFGVSEDPATGSAAAAFAGVIAAQAGLPDGEHGFAIEQGYEMGRPSLIRLAVTIGAAKLVSATIAGDAVVVTEGTIEA
jgi:trans-2,3-dihydro-3-hydroxyanthranilate isomerase